MRSQLVVCDFEFAEGAFLAQKRIDLFYVQSFFGRHCAGTNLALIVVK